MLNLSGALGLHGNALFRLALPRLRLAERHEIITAAARHLQRPHHKPLQGIQHGGHSNPNRLRQLEAQSLLQVVAHKGAVVAPLIGEDAVDTYALRVILESEALRQSIPLLEAEDIALARSYITQLENETRHAEIGRLNRLFHMTLYSKASNKKLLQLIETELNEEERFLRFHLSSMGPGKLTQDDHNDLVEAASNKAVDDAIRVLERHLNKAAQIIKAYLSRQPAA